MKIIYTIKMDIDLQTIIVEGKLSYDKCKSITGEYAHHYGDITFKKRTQLDYLLEKSGMLHDLPKYYKGHIETIALCKDIETGKNEIYDIEDVTEPETELCEGIEIVVTNNKWVKNTIFQKMIDGSFYKWETTNGFFMILTQKEVDSLNPKEKRYLRI